jgi:hypothetical protein
MKLTREGLRLIILEQLSMVRKNHSGWQGWVSEDVDDEEEEEDDIDISIMSELAKTLREVQEMSWNPIPNGGFEPIAGTPHPVLQGRVCGPKSDEDAAEMFAREKGLEGGEYFVTCTLASGTGKMGLAGIISTPDFSPYPRQFVAPRGGKKCWTCVANKDSGAAEQALSYPDEDAPPGAESI